MHDRSKQRLAFEDQAVYTRRRFLSACASAGLSLPIAGCVHGSCVRGSSPSPFDRTFAVDQNRVRFFDPAVQAPLKVVVIGDTHLSMDDARGVPFKAYSGRMAAAYQSTRHFRTEEPTNPQEGFEQAVALAKTQRADLLVLVGDIFSFPSEAAIEWVGARLRASGVPFLYIAGNHDWHYEGMAGTEAELRAKWTAERLGPLYQGDRPLMAVREIGGVHFVAIDDSTYEITSEQLDFFRGQVASGRPMVLFMHIPLYAPGRDVGFGCGHPQWGAATDKNWRIERRLRWPVGGHTPTTMAFRREVFAAPNLLGVVAGHIHRPSLDCVCGIPQFVVEANACGAYLAVEFLPAPKI